MTTEMKNFIISCIESKRGDDYVWAQYTFKNYTPQQMHQQYGQSGRTCTEVLNGYALHDNECTAAINEMNKL